MTVVRCAIPAKQPQFQILRQLVAKAKEAHSGDTYCVFSDDDDLWHPQRIEYARSVATGGEIGLLSGYATSRVGHGIQATESRTAAAVQEAAIANFEQVEVALVAKKLTLVTSEREEPEYWQFVVPLQMVSDFLTEAAGLLDRTFCDMYFGHWLHAQWSMQAMNRVVSCALFYRESGPGAFAESADQRLVAIGYRRLRSLTRSAPDVLMSEARAFAAVIENNVDLMLSRPNHRIADYFSGIGNDAARIKAPLRPFAVEFLRRRLLVVPSMFLAHAVDLFRRDFAICEPKLAHCSECSVPEPPLRCRGCKAALYCSAACQRQHWRSHKQRCLEIQELLR